MTYDDKIQTLPEFLETIENQTNALTTLNPNQSEDALLTAQSELLNQLFENIALDHLTNPPDYRKHYNEPAQAWLMLALKAQKQCTQAIKTKAAARYMNSLSPTPPIKHDERNDEV